MRVRRDQSLWKVATPAKLNFYLEILGRRADGFHELETLITPIAWCDELRWAAGDRGPLRLQYDPATPARWQTAAPAGSDNLAVKAMQLAADAAGVRPYGSLELLKRIPVGGGLGGGSSNAAGALLLANEAWGLRLPAAVLQQLAARLGSDVPFFLAGGAAICRGRGERVEGLGRLPRLPLVVAFPPLGLSTAAVFGHFAAAEGATGRPQSAPPSWHSLLAAWRRGASTQVSAALFNRLQQTACRLAPTLAKVERALAAACGRCGLMTGSGSSWFGLARTARHARRVAALLSSQNLGVVVATGTCT